MFAMDEIILKNKADSYYIKKCDNKYIIKTRLSHKLRILNNKFNKLKKQYNNLNSDYYILLSEIDDRIISKMKNEFVDDMEPIIENKISDHISSVCDRMDRLLKQIILLRSSG
jgi:hypothetical protein